MQKRRFRAPTMFKRRLKGLWKAWDFLSFSMPSGRRLYIPFKPNLLLLHVKQKQSTHKHLGYYQFSPPSTPRFYHNRKLGGISSLLPLCWCSGCGAPQLEEEMFGIYDAADHVKSDSTIDIVVEDDLGRDQIHDLAFECSDENDSVDQRAEKFIERFYEGNRIQRQESALQYMEMMSRGCS